MSSTIELKRGDVLNNQELRNNFKCGVRGGMRKSNKTNSLVIVSDITRGIYHDHWEGSIFHYTGMGYRGDQTLTYQNKTLYESKTNGVDVFFFEVYNKGKYIYQGQVELVDKPYQTTQLDLDGNNRKVWIFPIIVVDITDEPLDDLQYQQEIESASPMLLSPDPLDQPGFIDIRGKREWKKNPSIAKTCLINSNYSCENNKDHQTFTSKATGQNFVEAHHLIPMSYQERFKYSLDHPANILSLCPNCHRLLHHAQDEDKEKVLRFFYHQRKARLETAGIQITYDFLFKIYSESKNI